MAYADYDSRILAALQALTGVDENGEPIGLGSYDLLSNDAATGEWVEVRGGTYIWSAVGTFSGATLTLQAKGPDGSTAMDVSTLTAAGSDKINIADGTQMRVAITGGSPSGIYSGLGAI